MVQQDVQTEAQIQTHRRETEVTVVVTTNQQMGTAPTLVDDDDDGDGDEPNVHTTTRAGGTSEDRGRAFTSL